jgi:hypothetical protein
MGYLLLDLLKFSKAPFLLALMLLNKGFRLLINIPNLWLVGLGLRSGFAFNDFSYSFRILSSDEIEL